GWDESGGEGQQPRDGSRRGLGVEAGVFLRGANEQSAIQTRHEVALAHEQERTDAYLARVQQRDLAADGADTRMLADLGEQRFAPRAGRDQVMARGEAALFSLDGEDARALEHQARH